MRLCMFTPADRNLERGWPGRIAGDRVTQLAAQTLQSYFTGGGKARDHPVYALAHVRLRAPVLHPPSVRLFDSDGRFAFGNPASIVGPDAEFPLPGGGGELHYEQRLAAVIGAEGRIGGFTQLVLWVALGSSGPRIATSPRRSGRSSSPPTSSTRRVASELVERAARNTRLFPADLVADAPLATGGPVAPGEAVELVLDGIGALRTTPLQRAAAS